MTPAEDKDGRKTELQDTPSIWFSKRFLVAITVFVCYCTSVMLMSNINIALVEMTSRKIITIGNRTIKQPAEFQWDPAVEGIISSTTSYAGLFSFGGGFLVSKFGGSTSSALCLMIGGIATILTQATLYLNFYLFVITRFIVGLSSNYFIVCTAEVYSRWFPIKERSTLISFCYTGMSIGMIITYPLLGYLANEFGWSMVFYVSGALAILSALLCSIIIKNQPSEDDSISKKELIYILEETNVTVRRKVVHPYRAILLSAPVWALCFGKFAFTWTDTLLSGTLPLYIEDMTHQSTDITGLMSSIPMVSTVFVHPASGILMDYWKNHTNITYTLIHKIIIGIGFVTASTLFFVAASFSNFTISMVLFVFIQILTAVIVLIFETLPVNIAPNHSSTVSGLVIVVTSLAVTISRTIIGFMTMHHAEQEWNNCFVIAAIIMLFGAAVFLKFGSSEAQSWSLGEEDEQRSLLHH